MSENTVNNCVYNCYITGFVLTTSNDNFSKEMEK